MTRFLPPLAVLAVAVVLVARVLAEPQRAVARSRIEDSTATEEEVDAHVARYGDREEDRWAAARSYLRLQKLEKAVAAVWPAGRAATYGPALRRFGGMALRTLGWAEGDTFEGPTPLAFLSFATLLDDGDAEARVHLERLTRTLDGPGMSAYYLAAFQRGGPRSRAAFADALRGTTQREYRSAAAIAAMRPDPYPERATDLEVLVATVRGDLRTRARMRWASACIALGRSEDPGALDALRQISQRLDASGRAAERSDARLADAGRLAGGDAAAADAIVPELGVEPTDAPVVLWYGEALVHRYRRGDATAIERIRALWDSPAIAKVPELRVNLAYGLLLGEEMPRADVPVDRWLGDLGEPTGPKVHRMIASAFRLRRRDAGAPGELLDLLGKVPLVVTLTGGGGFAGPAMPQPSIVGMRALLLYGDSSPH